MKTIYKKNPKKILGYLMAFAMVLFSFTDSIAQCTTVNVQISTATWANEISWDLTDSSGTSVAIGGANYGTPYANFSVYNNYVCLPAGCYNMNMYDSYGDGWNGGTYNLLDSASGASYATGGITAFVAFQTDVVCVGPLGCTDPLATNYDPNATVDDGSCTYSSCSNVTLYMYDSFGDGWNGSVFTMTGSTGAEIGRAHV